MINFRFHLISLIAVFLALAVGVVMGYAVLGQPTVDTLQSRVDSVEARANNMRNENDRLRAEQARLESVLAETERFGATNRLEDASVLPVAVRGVDKDKVTRTVQLARDAGATAPGIVWLEDAWGLADADETARLAAIVGTTSTTRAGVREAAARVLANRLTGGPTSGRDLLADLEDAGFIAFEDVDGIEFDSAKLDGRSSRVLVVGGSATATPLARSVMPLVTALADAGRLVAVADDWRETDSGPARGEELGVIRDDGDLRAQVATLDNLDTADGPLLAVLVLGDLGRGTIGHYGFGDGAERAVPEWWVE